MVSYLLRLAILVLLGSAAVFGAFYLMLMWGRS